ncbi:Transcription elongation factor, GreA/GreB family [Bradyrhizobium shewense]|uniref:Transcription elongation factor, GreA/GreB family n=1 Tax=Bradyrhizobium shewense TaxID=1761772 RepID=A0A1C3XQ37_9BRAD|nr:Transcription elongation factor, GreA/GreB family [Bradyrhizobium shewense]
MRSAGRDLSISVWGWGRIQQEIGRYAEAVKEFHPDASPFTDKILQATDQIIKTVQERGDAQALAVAAGQREILKAIESLGIKVAQEGASGASAGIEQHLNNEIDGYRDLIRQDKPKTAIELLTKLKDRVWSSASTKVKFRIAVNIGVALHGLGQYDHASSHLMEAADLDPDDPIGRANKIAALLLRGHRNEAHALAIASVAQFPDNTHVAAQRMLAVSSDEAVDDVWNALPVSVRTAPELYVNRLVSMREVDDSRWHQVAAEALLAHPADWRLQTINAEAVLERLLKGDPSLVGAAGVNLPTHAELEEASKVLTSSWKRVLNPEIRPQGAFAHNAALIKAFLGQLDAASQLLEEADAYGVASEESKFLRISIYRKQGKLDDAIRIADSLAETPRNLIVRADLLLQKEPNKVFDILRDRDSFTDAREIVGSSLTVVDAHCRLKDYPQALDEADRLDRRLPDEPHAQLAIYKVKYEAGSSEADKALDVALARVNDRTEFPTRFLVCETLATAGRHKDVVDLLRPSVSPRFDSPALRLLADAELKADHRAALAQLLGQMPDEVRKAPYYQRIAIGLALSTGDLAAAERQLRELLQIRPGSLALQLQLMSTLFRQNKEAELRAEAARAANEFTGAPDDLLTFAQFKKNFGDWREAHDLAYQTLLAHPGDERVNRAYAAIFLFEARSTPTIDVSPPHVTQGMAVRIKREDGTVTVYIIEPDAKLRPANTYLSPDHPIAKAMLGKAPGDHFDLPDRTSADIVWIKPKELHALHVVLEDFNNVFPEAQGLEKIWVDTSSPDGLQPMLDRVRERHDAIASVASKYDDNLLPLTFVAKMLGSDPVTTALGLASAGHRLRVCHGTEFERQSALRAIEENHCAGCVVDAVTLHFIRRLSLEKVVQAVCGPIGVVEGSVARIQRRIHELEERLEEPSMSVFYRDGQYFREEILPDQKRAALEVQRADRTWLAEHAQIIPAEGADDPSAEAGRLLEKLGSAFFDEVRAASSSGRIFLSEDLPMRMLAESEYGVSGCWLQVVLMVALERGYIRDREYADAIVALIEANEEFISVSSALLVSMLTGEKGTRLPEAFCKASTRLGGAQADASHLSVALGVVRSTWYDIALSPTLRQGIFGNLLENLTRDRTLGDVERILAFFDRFAQMVDSGSLRRYLRSWRRGHFI